VSKETISAKVVNERTLRVQAPSLMAENRPWCLVVVGGSAIGARFDLDDAATLGREAGSDIYLPEPSISRRHCHVFRKRGSYWVTDLGATNPTLVNGMQVSASPLLEGDLLTVGDLVLKLLGPRSPENALVAALRDQATKDALTSLANRRHFHAALERAFEVSGDRSRLALIVLDVDHFKHINDRFGHPAGDRVLTAVGASLRGGLRKNDLPGRIGGEEFAVLLPDTGAEKAVEVAERLRLGLEAMTVMDNDVRIPVTASFGVAMASDADAAPDALYARADASLYEAKRTGRNRVLLAPAPDVPASSAAD
jgi:diguanylate cyclase (GGDEF)-like protein